MRVLAITRTLPWPIDQGSRIRNYYFLKELSRRHEVVLISLSETSDYEEATKELESFCENVHVAVQKRSVLKKASDLLFSLIASEPYIASVYKNKDFRRCINELASSEAFDLLQVHEVYTMASMPGEALPVPVVLDAHNIEYLSLQRSAENERNVLRKLYYHYQARLMKRFEEKMLKRVAGVVSVSKREEEYFNKLGSNTRTISNGVPGVEKLSRPNAKRLLFVGELQYPPNAQGVKWFLEHCWPTIEKNYEEVTLSIVARSPGRALLRYASSRVTFHTDVDDIHQVFAESYLLVVPLLAGAGTRLKVLQAFSVGLPVVSTAVGAEGLGAQDRTHLLLGNTAQEFTSAIEKLLSDHAFAERLSQNALDLAARKFLWGEQVSAAEAWYEDVAR